jgi:F0F1-type ATP synthase assembly protein I
MVLGSSNRNEMGRYLAMSQVGMEMVVPIGLGVLVDHWLKWGPWGVIVGACLGLTIGFIRLIRFVSKEDSQPPPPGSKEGP